VIPPTSFWPPTAKITAIRVANQVPDGEIDWLELSVDADAESVDAVAELFGRHVYNQGVVLDEPFNQDDDGDNLEIDPTRPVRVSGYVPLNGPVDDVVQRLEEGLWHLRHLGTVSELRRQVQRQEDWANAWKDHFPVTRIGRQFVIRPTWREYAAAQDDVVIDLDPGMAFGTGLHPTTAMCLGMLESIDVNGKRLLDAGAGSGILSIAAIKLGARSSDALEVDPVAVSALNHNVELNGLTDKICVQVADVTKSLPVEGTYDLILANIISRILIQAVDSLAATSHTGTQIVLSGVIEEHESDVLVAFEKRGFDLVDRRVVGDWVSLLMEMKAVD
jgi:ribosomal protein L11 methyltransferase